RATCRPSADGAGPGVVGQLRPAAGAVAADVRAGQVDRAGEVAAGGGDSRPVQGEHAASKPGGVQGWLRGVFDLASGQANECQAGVPGADAFLQEAIY